MSDIIFALENRINLNIGNATFLHSKKVLDD